MKANIQQIKKKRIYSEEFKKEIVKAFESGRYSVLQLAKLYGMSDVTIYNWIYKYSTFSESGFRVVELKESSMDKLKAMEQRLKELEQIIGQKQIKIDYLEKLIDLAKEDLDIDIKKNYSTQPSAGSKTTGKK